MTDNQQLTRDLTALHHEMPQKFGRNFIDIPYGSTREETRQLVVRRAREIQAWWSDPEEQRAKIIVNPYGDRASP